MQRASGLSYQLNEGEPWHVGFVCHHVGVDGMEVLRRAAEVGLGGTRRFGDLDKSTAMKT